jgi:3-deoxy-D-manno-octulosonic-acid transferase
VRSHQLQVRRRSWGLKDGPQALAEVVLLDTLGELATLYALGTVVFVGGSFVPIGGHNVLEPAAHRRPIVFGPHMHNFHQIAAALLDADGAVQVYEPAGLGGAIIQLLHHAERCRALGEAAYQVLRQNQGAIARTVELVEPLLRQGE